MDKRHFFLGMLLPFGVKICIRDQQSDEADALARIREFYSTIANHVSNYSYSNSVDYDIGDDYLQQYYGDNLRKLVMIKNKYDPGNVFNWRQSIPLN